MAGLQTVQDWAIVSGRGKDPESEAALIAQGCCGDARAFERLLTPHERSLRLLCCGVLGNADDADDAVQETFLRALKSIKQFRGNSSFRTWLYRIGVNVCVDWKRARRPAEAWRDLVLKEFAPSPEASVVSRMRAMDALQQLMPRHRAVVLLKEVEGLSIAEISDAMGWNEGKVQNELFKARRILAEWRKREEAESSSLEEGGASRARRGTRGGAER